jgi:PAS domain S-box-containing protein
VLREGGLTGDRGPDSPSRGYSLKNPGDVQVPVPVIIPAFGERDILYDRYDCFMTDRIRVLYVDDEPSLLEIAQQFLEKDGEFRVETTTSARKALDSSSILSYDVVISDYQMPDMDGIAFLKAVRVQFGDLPFILFTGRGREEVVIDAINNGADFYLQKGGDVKAQFAELAHKIRQAVARKRTEVAHRESERRLRLLIQQAPAALAMFDREMRYIVASRRWIADYHLNDREILGHSHYEIFPEISEELKAIHRRSLAGEILSSNEDKFVRQDGSVQWLAWEVRPWYETGNVIGGIIIFSEDISKRKRAEETLQESEEKFRSIVETSPNLIWETDLQGKFRYMSPIVQTILGYIPEESVGKSILDLVPEEGRSAATEELMHMISSEGALSPIEIPARHRNGSDILLEIRPARLIGTDGRLKGLRGVAVDITERKRMEEALRDSEARFRGMTERSSDLILILNKAMSPTYVSPSAQPMLGFAPEELVGKPPEFAMATIFSETGPALMNAVKATMSGLPVENVELQLSRKDKTPVIVSMLAVPILRDGILDGVQVTMRDITEQVVTQSALQAIVGSMVGTTGLNSLRKIAENVSSWLGADCVMVGEIQPDHDTVKVLSMILDGKQVNDFIYHLKGTPCENVAEKGFCHYPDDAIRLFPESRDLVELNIRGYIGTPLKNSDGNVIGILCALFRYPFPSSPKVQEIMAIIATKAGAEIERSRMERALRQSEEKYRSFVENANEIMFSLTPDGIFTYVSPNWSEWLGHTTGDVIGKPAADFIHPDDFPHYREVFLETLTTGKRMSGTEFRVRHKDGTWRWNSQSISPIRDTEGRVVAIQGISHDITDRKRAEDELKKSRYLLSEALDMAQMADWEADALTGVFTFNDQFYSLYGTTAEREGGYQMAADVYAREFVPKDDRFMVAGEIAKAHSTPESGYFSLLEHRIIPRDGEVRWITVRVRVTRDAQGRIIRIHGANQDITDRKRAEEAVRQANKKLNLLSGITRHDINNQLMVLNAFVTLLERELHDTPHEKYISRITGASENIADMIQFTKEYEQIGTGVPVWQDLATVITAAGKGIIPGQFTLINDLPATTEVFADPMLEKVFFNLLDNAVRHGGRVTQVRVSSRPSGEDLVIVWEDNGVGIPAGEKEYIFDRGFGKNTGLGMFLVREILSLTGISIMETGEPGRGARFEMTVHGGAYRIRSKP